jgi:hypothetical protein
MISCEESININTKNSPPVIVIYGSFTNDTAFQYLQITSSSPYFDNEPNRGISGANVFIKSSTNDIINFTENDTYSGFYDTDTRVAFIPGLTYYLNVEVDFDNDGVTEIYTATSQMPMPVEIDSIVLRNFQIVSEKHHALYLYAQDPPTEDYYLNMYKINGIPVLNKISEYSPMNDKAFNGQYVNGLMMQIFDDAEYKSDSIYLTQGDIVEFGMARIEKGYYNFILQCKDEIRGESPFFGSPASNITTNISNGAKGYFTCYPVTKMEAVVE